MAPQVPEWSGVDLPAVAPGGPGMGAPRPAAAAGFGEIDLMGDAGGDLSGGGGEVDLPVVPNRPTPAFGDLHGGAVDLPAIAAPRQGHGAPPRQATAIGGFGDLDLGEGGDSGAVDLPAARQAPAPGPADFGAIDLLSLIHISEPTRPY